MTPDTFTVTSRLCSPRNSQQKNVPFYYGYYSSKWGRLGEGRLCLIIEARDLVNWIKGGDVSTCKADARIKEVNPLSILDRNGSSNVLVNKNPPPEQQFTFGPSKKPSGQGLSPKTHLEGDSNFDEFLQRFDKDKADKPESDLDRSKNMARGGSDRLYISKYRKNSNNFIDFKNLNDDSDLLHSSTERIQDKRVNKSVKAFTPQKPKHPMDGPDRGQLADSSQKGIQAAEEYKISNRRKGSLEPLREIGGRRDSKDLAGNDKKNILMDLEHLFDRRKRTSRVLDDKSEEVVTPIKVRSSNGNDKDSSLKNSIVLFEQEVQSMRHKASGKTADKWQSARHPENLSETREVTREGAQPQSARIADLFLTKSPKSASSAFNLQHKKNRFFMTPLNIQKFCRAVQKAFKKQAVKRLVSFSESKKEDLEAACLVLSELVAAKTRSLRRLLFKDLKDRPLQTQKAKLCLEILENLLASKQKDSKRLPFSMILSQSLVSKNGKLKNVLDKLVDSPVSVKARSLLQAADLEEKKLDTLSRIIKKRDQQMSQALRRSFQHWISESDATPMRLMARSIRKLATVIEHRKTSDLLRGYYGIKAAGGRLDKLFIIVDKKQKIYTAKMRYCIKKLRIWNKFKSNVSENFGNVKTIIVRTVDPVEDQRAVQLKRIFFRKGFEELKRIAKQAESNDFKACFSQLKQEWLQSRERLRFFEILHQILYWKSVKQGWIELSIFNLQQKTIHMITSNKKEGHFETHNSKHRIVTRSSGALKNPLFKFIEERSLERGTAIEHESNNTNLSSEIEIFKSGLDLDEKLRKISNAKMLQGAKSLEMALKADLRFGSSPEVMKASKQRVLLLCLQKICKRRLYQAFESINDFDTRDKMKTVAIHFLHFGFDRTEKLVDRILLRSKYDAFRELRSLRQSRTPTQGIKSISLTRETAKRPLIPAFNFQRVAKDHLIERLKVNR